MKTKGEAFSAPKRKAMADRQKRTRVFHRWEYRGTKPRTAARSPGRGQFSLLARRPKGTAWGACFGNN
jgi:hypothetical protein